MSISLLQSVQVPTNFNSGSTKTLAYGSNNAAGSLLIAILRIANALAAVGSPTITDSAGNTWIKLQSYSPSASVYVQLWYAANAIAGANTVTLTAFSGVTFAAGDLAIFEYSGIAVKNAVVTASAIATGTGQNAQAGNSVIAPAGSLVVYFAANENFGVTGTVTALNGFTTRLNSSINLMLVDYQNTPNYGSYTPSVNYGSAGVQWEGFTSAFFAATPGGISVAVFSGVMW